MKSTYTTFPAFVSAPQGRSTYNIDRLIGRGGYGEVYHATSEKYPGFEFAIKVCPLSKERGAAITAAYESEVLALQTLDHPNVVRLYDTFKSEDESLLYIVLEYCPGGDLEELIKRQGELLTDNQRLDYAHQIALAVEICHRHHIAHRDLKTGNILFDAYGRCKVADFGLCQKLETGLVDTFSGSLLYAPPEILRGIPHSPFCADMWSLGVLFYRLVTGQYPWPLDATRECLRAAITAGDYRQSDTRCPLLSLVRKMIVVDPARRLTISELLSADVWKVGIGKPIRQIRTQKSIGDILPKVKCESPIPGSSPVNGVKSMQLLKWAPQPPPQRRKIRRYTSVCTDTFQSQIAFNLPSNDI